MCDVTSDYGLDRFGPGFITTIRVRLVHALVRRNLSMKKECEWNKWGQPINQIDMLATYLALARFRCQARAYLAYLILEKNPRLMPV